MKNSIKRPLVLFLLLLTFLPLTPSVEGGWSDVVYDVKEGTDMIVADCGVITQRGRIDGERMGLDCEIYLSGCAYGKERINTLTALHFGELVKRDNGRISVCFPSSSDSLWSVGKRYNVSTEKIIEDNKINVKPELSVSADSHDSIGCAHHLIIST